MTERPTVMERLSAAKVTDDLSHRSGVCPVDWVGALGFAGIHDRHGSALLDLDLTLEPAAVADAMKATMQLTRRLADKRGWPVLHVTRLRRISMEALSHYLRPACGCCKGRGVVGVEHLPEETLHACSHCKGTGRRGRSTCPHCHGKGKVRKIVARAYNPRPCGPCGGTGKRPLPFKDQRQIREVLYVMEEARRRAGAGVKRAMEARGAIE